MEVVKNQSDNRLECQFDVQPDTYDDPVIKFMLQPIVENSVKFRARGDHNFIWISAFHHGDGLVIAIKDTGTGLTREYADKNKFLFYSRTAILRESITVSGTGIGLSNISKRLHYSFGPESFVKIDPNEDGGAFGNHLYSSKPRKRQGSVASELMENRRMVGERERLCLSEL